jgi:hypothetical protein
MDVRSEEVVMQFSKVFTLNIATGKTINIFNLNLIFFKVQKQP